MGAFICSHLDLESAHMAFERQSIWVRKSGETVTIDDPVAIVESGRESLELQGKWTYDKEQVYKERVLPILAPTSLTKTLCNETV